MLTKNKVLGKIALATTGVVMSVGLLNSFTSEAQTSGSGYCWATLSIVAGIAVCDGSSNNCTKPC